MSEPSSENLAADAQGEYQEPPRDRTRFMDSTSLSKLEGMLANQGGTQAMQMATIKVELAKVEETLCKY